MLLLQNIIFIIILTVSFYIPFSSTTHEPSAKIISPFKSLAHGVSSGQVTVLDSKRILIQGLRYDGAGPDAYFWVGNGISPNKHGIKIQNELGSSDVLSGYQGQDIELTLPGLLTFNDIDWLSIWCVAYEENFGYVLIPKNLNLPEYGQK